MRREENSVSLLTDRNGFGRSYFTDATSLDKVSVF